MASRYFVILFSLLTSSIFCQWNYVGSKGFTPFEADFVFIAINPVTHKPCVAFRDIHNYSKASMMEFNGSAWEYVGIPGFSDGDSDGECLTFSTDGIPYIAFMDGGHDRKATVMKFNGVSWEPVGQKGFTPSAASFESIAIDSRGVPYVAFRDVSKDYKATVMKFNGNNWENVGQPGFSTPGPYPYGAAYISLAIDKNDMPIIAYSDDVNYGRATVQRFDGNNWQVLGTAGFAGYNSQFAKCLAVDSKNNPVLACQLNGKVTVYKFENNSWTPVGQPSFSQGGAEYVSLAIDKTDTIYVAYQDYGVTRRASVMKYDGEKWIYVGSQGFSSSSVQYVTCDVDADRNLYVAFADNDSPQWNATVMKFQNVNAVGVKKNEEVKTVFDIYPNPASKNITIKFQTQTEADVHVTLTNNIGQVISYKNYPNSSSFTDTYDLTRFSKGIYFVEITGSSCHECKKIVIE